MSKLLLHADKDIPEFIYKKVNNIIKNMKVENMYLSSHIYTHINNATKPKTKNCLKHNYTEEELWDCIYYLKDNPVKPFEVELEYDESKASVFITKYVIRMQFDDDRDISISIRGKKVITAWLNYNTDLHGTLDLSKYDYFKQPRTKQY